MLPSAEMRQMFYDTMPIVGWLFVLILFFSQHKKFTVGYGVQSLQNRIRNKKLHTLIKIIEMFLTLLVLPLSTLFFNNWFGELMKTGANYYGFLFFCPIALFVFCCIVWANPIKRFDFLTVLMPFEFIFIRLGCLFQGCCNGVGWEYGIYNYFSERPEVPTPLLESILALGLFIFLLIWRKKAKPGTLYPMYLLLYSFFRFFIEFFSTVRVKYFNFFNKYQFLCLAGMLVGSVLLLLMTEYGEKISTYFDENPYGFIKALIVKIKKPKNQKIKTK